MKNLLLILAAFTATTANASVLHCMTHPGPTGAQYGVSITPDENTVNEAQAHITLSGGRARFIMIVGDYPVQINHLGPEVATFTNTENEFQLTVYYQGFGDAPYFRGNLKLNAVGRHLDVPVVCR